MSLAVKEGIRNFVPVLALLHLGRGDHVPFSGVFINSELPPIQSIISAVSMWNDTEQV